LRRAGFAKGLEEPPLSFAGRLAGEIPAQAEALLSVSQRYSDWRYAGLALTEEQQRDLIRRLRGFRISNRRTQ
jgi:hypothetical protein